MKTGKCFKTLFAYSDLVLVVSFFYLFAWSAFSRVFDVYAIV